ncbi:UvrD-helicase domain-containing protein [candidate division KSB1 bacterium]|nr:UvrD-helicase domain-containing protein [candidate division KSB1 bacterium]
MPTKVKNSILKGLNAVQKQAVEFTDGPSLILAGAGSGKTKVLTHKIAYLIGNKKVPPSKILALTFTNKAAKEMRERIGSLLQLQAAGLWCSTFHSYFAFLLRRDCEKIGFTPNYSIYDESEQKTLIKLLMTENEIDMDSVNANSVRSRISRLKNKLVSVEQYQQEAFSDFEQIVADLYGKYQQHLKKNNAMDFDDLLLKPIELFNAFPLVLQYYQDRWQYILIDEYQDTNHPQYVLLKMLSAKYRNISVVGDDDQSIYRWRGADVQNILDFENDFPECKIFKLEQNYRSTSHILKAAHSVITNNSRRMDKELWTENDEGEPVSVIINPISDEEAIRIVEKIQEQFHTNKRNFSDFAILYRTNAQSRALEDGLRKNGISYVIVGGVRFYERKEIKDVLAYFKVLCNPADEISIKRIINFPTRGIGQVTINKIDNFCNENNVPFIEGLKRIDEIDKIADKTKARIQEFYQLISKYNELQSTFSVIEIATALVEEIGILQQLKEEGTLEATNRIQNIRELLNTINEFIHERENPKLEDFLAEVALVTDIDSWNKNSNAVTLMTLHAAKGLEFPVVFITGLEEGLFPLGRAIEEEDIDEERRLFYVGATRAEEKLYLCCSKRRIRYDGIFEMKPSRFLSEIHPELINVEEPAFNARRFTRNYYNDSQPKISPVKIKSDDKKLKIGALVKHNRFGRGVVKKIEGDGEGQKARILFQELGEKVLIVKYAKLEIL